MNEASHNRPSAARLRIGLLVDSMTVPAWVAAIVEGIQGSDFARVELVICNSPLPPPPPPGWRQRWRERWKRGLYHRYRQWDRQRQRPEADAFAEIELQPLVGSCPQLQVVPERTRFSDRLSAADSEAVRGARLDVLFRFGFRILRGEVLQAARYGVWSYHHGDNREYRGSAAGFWEMHERQPVTGSILQQLNESLDAGRVLYRSWSATDPYSQFAGLNPMYWKTSAFALRRLRDLHTRGWDYLQSLPDFREPNRYRKPLYHVPSAPVMARFLARQAALRVGDRLHALAGARQRNWFVAWRPRGVEPTWSNADGFQEVPQPADRFYADPCLWEQGGQCWLFFEDYDYAAGRAHISYLAMGREGPMGAPQPALQQDCHLSYPFLFQYGGETYMIPETRQRRRIDLYRAVRFPDHWERADTLLDNVDAVDATLLQHDGRYWLFTNLAVPGASVHDELHLFSSDKLTGPWRPHPCNPVVSDVRRARPAGAVLEHEGRLIRPGQDCSRRYGWAIQFQAITVLNEKEYHETPFARLEPDWRPGLLATHTYSRSEHFEVLDGMRIRRVPRARRTHVARPAPAESLAVGE